MFGDDILFAVDAEGVPWQRVSVPEGPARTTPPFCF